MSKYDGERCISCGEIFSSGDDVVVCPDCGTPYHRECYKKEGKCIADELHAIGASWLPEKAVDDGLPVQVDSEHKNEPVKCARCGEENSSEKLFCEKCGMPLRNSIQPERPFNNVGTNANVSTNTDANTQPPQYHAGGPFVATTQMKFDAKSDLDGVLLEDYAKYIGKNPFLMLTNFIKFSKFGRKMSFNFGAFLFPQFYLFYRKMPLLGAVAMILTTVLGIPNLILMGQEGAMGVVFLNTSFNVDSNTFVTFYNFSQYALLILELALSFFVNYIYYRKARKDITEIRGIDGIDEQTASERIRTKGGTSMAMMILSVLIGCALSTFAMFVMNNMFA